MILLGLWLFSVSSLSFLLSHFCAAKENSSESEYIDVCINQDSQIIPPCSRSNPTGSANSA